MTVHIAHTADLDAATLTATRAMLDAAFGGDFGDEDWDHALGGIHALLWDGPDLVGHAAVVQRRLLHAGRALRTGYVEGVAVRADRRRRGHAAALMHALERIIRGGYELGGLATSDAGAPLSKSVGWTRWQGPTFALTPGGVTRTQDADGAIFVLPVTVTVDLAGELTCDWRDGDVW